MDSGEEPSTHSVVKIAVHPLEVPELVNCHMRDWPHFRV